MTKSKLGTWVHIFVQPRVDGMYDIVAEQDDKPWLVKGPYADLDFANMICREMLKRAEELSARAWQKLNDPTAA